MSRTSTTLKPKRGKAGIEPSRSFLIASIEAEKSDPSTGPRTRLGLMVTSSSPPPSSASDAQAARSAMVLARSWGDVSRAVCLVGPILLGERLLANSLAKDDRRDRRRHHNAPHPGVAGGPQYTQRPIPRRVASIRHRPSVSHRNRNVLRAPRRLYPSQHRN
jgi:hypothetical protein